VGENHAVYKASYVDAHHQVRAVVVRIATSDRALDCAEAGREATALRKVQGFVAPLLHDFRCDSEWFGAPVMCMTFVGGVQRAPRDAQDFERLGRSVAWVHGLPTRDLAEWLPDEPTLLGYLGTRLAKIDERLPWIRDPLPAAVQDRLRRALAAMTDVVDEARRAESFQAEESLVLLHGDVAGGNIVWTPDPVLIDWEYARIGDPADEVAYVFAQHDCTPEQRTMFWRGYRQGRDRDHALDHVVDRSVRWEPITILGSAMFWAQPWSRRAEADADARTDPTAPKELAHYRKETIRRIERFEALLGRVQEQWRTDRTPGAVTVAHPPASGCQRSQGKTAAGVVVGRFQWYTSNTRPASLLECS